MFSFRKGVMFKIVVNIEITCWIRDLERKNNFICSENNKAHMRLK